LDWLVDTSPDLLLFSAVGIIAWLQSRPRETELACLALVVLLICMVTASKYGSDLNYFLGLRAIEALAVGKLWHCCPELSGPRLRVATAGLVLGAITIVPSVRYATERYVHARRLAAHWVTISGGEQLSSYFDILEWAEQPDARILTDSSVVALRQRDRAPFLDPFLFRMLVHTGQIEPTELERRLCERYYDALVLVSDLEGTKVPYEDNTFGLPRPLLPAIRRNYELEGFRSGFFIYRPLNHGDDVDSR
jgi:hypothetical protein